MKWQEGTLQDLVFFQRGFDISKAEQKEGNVPVISSSGVQSYHSEFKANAPGIALGRKGTLGSVHFADVDYWPHSTTLWSKRINGNPRYIYYFLHTLQLESFDVGNSNPTLNRNHIHNLKIKIPPPETQNKIADILSRYDEVIANNRRRIELLERSARLLYREWFVYFRYPGHEHETIGSDGIPEGWEKKQVKQLLSKVERPKKVKKEEYLTEGFIPCIDQSKSFIGGYTNDIDSVISIECPVIIFGDRLSFFQP
jgi:type I restriction enzyme S subunit